MGVVGGQRFAVGSVRLVWRSARPYGGSGTHSYVNNFSPMHTYIQRAGPVSDRHCQRPPTQQRLRHAADMAPHAVSSHLDPMSA